MQAIRYDFTIYVFLIKRVIATKKCIIKWPRHTTYITWALMPLFGLKVGQRLSKNTRVQGKVIANTLHQTGFWETFAIQYAIHLHTIDAQMICNLCDRAGSLAQFAQVAPKNLMDGYFLVAASQRKSLPFFAVHSY